jgi:hypothetical protein
MEQWAQEVASHERTHDTHNDIGDQALPIIRLHDNAGYPADQSPYDDPNNEVNHFSSPGKWLIECLSKKDHESMIRPTSLISSIGWGVFVYATSGR